jgi:hypothetical protein
MFMLLGYNFICEASFDWLEREGHLRARGVRTFRINRHTENTPLG